MAVSAFVFLFVGVWAAVFGAPIFAALFLAAAAIWLPVLNRRPRVLRARLVLVGVLFGVTVVLAGLPMREVNRRVSALAETHHSKYTLADKLGVWGLNLVMAGFGCIPFPEVALETALLAVPRQDSTTIVFHSGFGLRSSRIRSQLERFAGSLQGNGGSSVVEMAGVKSLGLFPGREDLTAFRRKPSLSKLMQLYWDYRCALALNPVDISARAVRRGGRWLLDVRYRVPVEYRQGRTTPLLPNPLFPDEPLVMRDGVFWALQEQGWLHPYTAEYRCVVYADRLSSGRRTARSLEPNVRSRRDPPPVRDGDIVFHTSNSAQSIAVQKATGSKYSHMGIILTHGGRPCVFEAVEVVRYTPLETWIDRGRGGHYVIRRLRGADTLLTSQRVAMLRRAAGEFEGRSYDEVFEWSDARIYCSELVWKMYDRALGAYRAAATPRRA